MDARVNFTDREIADLKEYTNEAVLADAVRKAMREYLGYARRLRLLQKFAGRIELLENSGELEGEATGG
jgi:predicted DNA-binding protein YlxM (UPF0122 family)